MRLRLKVIALILLTGSQTFGQEEIDNLFFATEKPFAEEMTCNGMNNLARSPHDLIPSKRVVFLPLVLENYDARIKSATVTHNGRTLIMTIKSSKMPSIKGGPLPCSVYEFHSLQFRWATTKSHNGADHAIAKEIFPLEAQFIHINKKYPDFETAEQKSDGIAVLSFLFKYDTADNNHYSPIFDLYNTLRKPGRNATVDIRSLQVLLPTIDYWKWDYYTYHGSLTFEYNVYRLLKQRPPPCFLSTRWIVSAGYLNISEKQVSTLGTLVTTNGYMLYRNSDHRSFSCSVFQADKYHF